MPSTQPVIIPLSELTANPHTLQPRIAAAFGSDPGSLGIVLVSQLPDDFASQRAKLFRLIHRFATLPEEVRERCARETSCWCFGWSHGKEVMNGRPDTQKGSYYANPMLDRPDVTEAKRKAHPEYYAGNVWPDEVEGMEEFEATFKALGKIIHDVGLALARACELFCEAAPIEGMIRRSQANKARLLHYYAMPPDDNDPTPAADSFCGTHIDHSLLTGLCSAMYLCADGSEVASPDSQTGLHIFPRGSESAIKVSIPPDCLAFQIGEALELVTAGKLAATPHYVSGPRPGVGAGVSRETFAFFLQPDVDDVVSPNGETFGQFTKRVLERHYDGRAVA